MSANRLLKLTKTCKKINIDKESKIVLMSDVHRGDGGSSDSLIGNKNIYLSALRYYYKEDYTLIEIGDGDELWKNKNFIDIGYIYKEVFRMLNRFNTKNKLYMLYGNHDKKKNSKKFIEKQKKLFKKIDKDFGKDCLNLINNIEFLEALSLKYIHNGKEIFLAHGHQLDFMNDELELVSRFLVRYLWRFLEGVAGFKEPISSAKNYKKGSKVDKKLNDFANKNKKMIICGHTHNVKFPEVGKGLYFNDGCCVNPGIITSLEINNGLITLIKWSIEVNENNNLYIKRGIIDGPERIGDYLKYTD